MGRHWRKRMQHVQIPEWLFGPSTGSSGRTHERRVAAGRAAAAATAGGVYSGWLEWLLPRSAGRRCSVGPAVQQQLLRRGAGRRAGCTHGHALAKAAARFHMLHSRLFHECIASPCMLHSRGHFIRERWVHIHAVQQCGFHLQVRGVAPRRQRGLPHHGCGASHERRCKAGAPAAEGGRAGTGWAWVAGRAGVEVRTRVATYARDK